MLQPYQERVLIEREDLATKVNRLCNFLDGLQFQTLSDYEQRLLRRQAMAMANYLLVLDERIKAFGV